MIPEIGQFALAMALAVAIIQTVFPLVGAHRRVHQWMAVAVPSAQAQFVFLSIALVCLTAAFLKSDFSVRYVMLNSNEALPVLYKISAVWGAHEGSLLLWAWILGAWTAAVSLFSRNLPGPFRARVLGVMGFVSIGFLLFMMITSNPFDRILPAPPHGRDLNPLLQDPGLIIHPPMLYMGYVGLCVPFAFAIAALLDGRLDPAWTRWTRPWTIIAWVFLTAGITLGSWWAYNELGWGGWWFWDPVENASFMPWLMATALIHSLAVTEKRGAFRAWTVLLSIFAFSLSLLGTFLVRSGVLVSVHAFASDPERGSFILAFLVIVIGLALALYAWRATDVSGGGQFTLMSRETLLLVNNVLLVVACATVLLGTLYPLIADAFLDDKISVGKPWFEAVFAPLMLPLAFVLGIGPLTRWKRDSAGAMAKRLRVTFILAVALGVGATAIAFPPGGIAVAISLALTVWVCLTTLQAVWARIANKREKLRALAALPAEFFGMVLAHIGLAVFIAGVTVASTYSVEQDVSLKPGDTHELAGYKFEFQGVTDVVGPNYTAERGRLVVSEDGVVVATLHPEKRHYPIQAGAMTEADVDAGLFRDLYVAMGERLGGNAWSVRLYHKPFVRWIWLGPLLMVIGGLIAAGDRRYRMAPSRSRAGTDASASTEAAQPTDGSQPTTPSAGAPA
jgi:cytochrome c-type biogenesis protein CcmF